MHATCVPGGDPLAAATAGDGRDRELHRDIGDRRAATDPVHAELRDCVWREIYRILPHTTDDTTARRILSLTFERVPCQLMRPDGSVDKEKIRLLCAAADLCIARLLEQAHADLARRAPSRAVDLILAYFDGFIVRTVRRKVNRPCDIDSIVNDVRRRVWCKLETFEGERLQLRKYIELACGSACTDDYRRNTRRGADGQIVDLEPLTSDHDVPSHSDGNQRALESAEVRIELERGMQSLSRDQKTAVDAYLHYGSWVVAERELGIRRQTLQSRFESACRALRPRFSDGH